MKTTKTILTVISFLLLTAFTNKTETKTTIEDGYYYFAYASLDKEWNKHLYITPVLFISKSDCNLNDPRSDSGVSNQFNDYMKAEYNGILYKCEGRVYENTIFSKAEIVKTRRKTMEYYKKVTKITDFEYLCD